MINNRQNGRRRGRGNNNGGGGGNNNPRAGGQGRGDNGNRIDNRSRGNAAQLLEKYKSLASDAQRQGDRVNTEYYLQFADHYFRVLADQRGRFEDQQPQQRRPQNDYDLDGDDDYGEEGEPIRAGEQQGDGGDDRQDRQQDNRQDRQQQDRQQQDGRQQSNRDHEPRSSQRGQDRQQQGRQQEQGEGRRWEPRDDRSEADHRVTRNDRDDRPDRSMRDRDEQRVVAGQHRSDPPVPGEQPGERAEQVLEADAPTTRRRGRPRRDAGVATEPAGVDADRLPPSLGIAAVAANDSDGEEPKPRRRRTPRATTEGAPAAE